MPAVIYDHHFRKDQCTVSDLWKFRYRIVGAGASAPTKEDTDSRITLARTGAGVYTIEFSTDMPIPPKLLGGDISVLGDITVYGYVNDYSTSTRKLTVKFVGWDGAAAELPSSVVAYIQADFAGRGSYY